MVFGDASAHFRAQYVSQENARIYQKEFPHTSTTGCKSTYMDDSLDSVRDNQMAIQLFEELQALWSKAGMKARKWLSNSPEVLTMIPQELRAYEINLKDSLPAAKTLGVLWRAQQDVLTFQAKKLPEEDKLKKRIILSKVEGVFDPLGLAVLLSYVQKSSYRECGPRASTGTSLLITNFQVEQKNGSPNWWLCRKLVFRDPFKNQNAKSPFPCKLSLTPQVKHMMQ